MHLTTVHPALLLTGTEKEIQNYVLQRLSTSVQVDEVPCELCYDQKLPVRGTLAFILPFSWIGAHLDAVDPCTLNGLALNSMTDVLCPSAITCANSAKKASWRAAKKQALRTE
jgi:hypothetical protein